MNNEILEILNKLQENTNTILEENKRLENEIKSLKGEGTEIVKPEYNYDGGLLGDLRKGTYEDGNSIKLSGIEEGSRSPYFKIEENRVRYLDMDGTVVEGELESYYILLKEGNPMIDKAYQMVMAA